jgi:hypothetical protein
VPSLLFLSRPSSALTLFCLSRPSSRSRYFSCRGPSRSLVYCLVVALLCAIDLCLVVALLLLSLFFLSQLSSVLSLFFLSRPFSCPMRTRQARLLAEAAAAAAAPAEESSESFLDHFTGKRVSLILVDGTPLTHTQLRAQIRRPLMLIQAEAWFFAQQSPGMKRQREASPPPFSYMLTEFSSCVLVRFMLDCVATACRRLAITPAGVNRTTGRCLAAWIMDLVTRGRVRRVLVQP